MRRYGAKHNDKTSPNEEPELAKGYDIHDLLEKHHEDEQRHPRDVDEMPVEGA
jgi:hypothetical protein